MTSLEPQPTRRGVVAVVVREACFLVIRRSRHVVAPGALCFPGGGIESGESEAEALVREFQEELNAPIRPVRRIWTSTSAWHVDLAWWLGELTPNVELIANPAEVESFRWLSPAAMLVEPKLLASNHAFLQALAAKEIILDASR